MGNVIFTIFAFVLATSILVAVHEYGHYIVARLCGVKVLNFSIGFGPKLFSRKTKSGTLFSVAAIPLGGYVKMLDERETDIKIPSHDFPYVFNRKHPCKKLAIVLAGPIFNFILAFVAFYFMFLRGIDVERPIIQYIQPGSLADQAKIINKQEIVSIDNTKVYSIEDLHIALAGRLGTSGRLVIQTKEFDNLSYYKNKNKNNKSLLKSTKYDSQSMQPVKYNTYYINLNNWSADLNKEPIAKSLGIWLSPKDENSLYVDNINPSVGANLGDLKIGDFIVGYNHEILKKWDEFLLFIKSNASKTIQIEVLRDGKIKRFPIVIGHKDSDHNEGLLGITFKYPFYFENQSYGVTESATKAIGKTIYYTNQTFYMVYKLVTGQVGLDTVRGPVMVARAASIEIQMGISYFLNFLAVISIGLGVINLLPVPVLDGGHVVYHLYELITGKQASMLAEKIGVVIGGIFLVLLMIVAFYNDIIYW